MGTFNKASGGKYPYLYAVIVVLMMAFVLAYLLWSETPIFNYYTKPTLTSTIASVMLTITNSQDTPSAAGFQQMISINPSVYAMYEAANLGNIRFYIGAPNDGTELYSWCESGCNASSSNATFWVKIPDTIGAMASLEINMTFDKLDVNYDDNYAGEAPQLSPEYAEYDNGRNVFNFYDDFAGTSLNSTRWASAESGCGSVVVADGLELIYAGRLFSGLNATYPISVIPANNIDAVAGEASITSKLPGFDMQKEVEDMYMYTDSFMASCATNNCDNFGMLMPQPTAYRPAGADQIFISAFAPSNGTVGYYGVSTYNDDYVNPVPAAIAYHASDSAYNIFSLWASANSAYASNNYGPASVSTEDFPAGHTSDMVPWFIISDLNQTPQTFYMRWVRIRVLPPNGVMPGVAVGALYQR
jgi:hypothetical protein